MYVHHDIQTATEIFWRDLTTSSLVFMSEMLTREHSQLKAVSQRPLFKKQRSRPEEVKSRQLRVGKKDGTSKKVVSTVKAYLRRQNSARKWMEETLHIRLPKRTSDLCNLMVNGYVFCC